MIVCRYYTCMILSLRDFSLAMHIGVDYLQNLCMQPSLVVSGLDLLGMRMLPACSVNICLEYHSNFKRPIFMCHVSVQNCMHAHPIFVILKSLRPACFHSKPTNS